MALELRGVITSRRVHRPQPPPTGLVLEIGGGQAPFPRASVVVDKYVLDSFERSGEAELSLARPLIVADGHALPFADGSFTYSIASHVLEHATDPCRFAGELTRVSPAGFVQVPSRESELTFGWPYHPWLIDLAGERLIFERKGDREAPLGGFFHDSFASSPLMRLWWAAHRSDWHHSLHWRGHLDVETRGTGQAEQTADLDVERTVEHLASLSKAGRVPPLPPEVRSAIRCPACHGSLDLAQAIATCASCGRGYPVAGSVPVLLEEAVAVAPRG